MQNRAVQSPLLGQALPIAQLIDPKARLSESELDWVMPDSAIVILLGGTGCSMADQLRARLGSVWRA